jgi:O-methyltransferase involved in polyketide biosynthesis
MFPGQPSQTMVRTAIRRAAHQLLDSPRIFDDPLAVDLIPETSEQAILATADDHLRPMSTMLRSVFALRSRFTEDRLAEAALRGVSQYVILGAGLDTFPWRQPHFAGRCEFSTWTTRVRSNQQWRVSVTVGSPLRQMWRLWLSIWREGSLPNG